MKCLQSQLLLTFSILFSAGNGIMNFSENDQINSYNQKSSIVLQIQNNGWLYLVKESVGNNYCLSRLVIEYESQSSDTINRNEDDNDNNDIGIWFLFMGLGFLAMLTVFILRGKRGRLPKDDIKIEDDFFSDDHG